MDDGTAMWARESAPSGDAMQTLAPPVPPPPTNPERRRRSRTITVVVTVVAMVVTAGFVLLYFLTREDRDAAVRDRDRARAELAEVQERLDAESARLVEAEEAADARASVLEASEANADRIADDLAEREAALAEREEALDAYRAATVDFLTFAFTEGSGIDPAGADCMATALVDEQGGDALRRVVAAATGGAGGVGALGRDLDRVAPDCGVDLDQLAADAIPGEAYGDNPELDALYDACTAGDGAACDDLYFASAVDTEYERYGLTCGDRFTVAEAPALCADAI